MRLRALACLTAVATGYLVYMERKVVRAEVHPAYEYATVEAHEQVWLLPVTRTSKTATLRRTKVPVPE